MRPTSCTSSPGIPIEESTSPSCTARHCISDLRCGAARPSRGSEADGNVVKSIDRGCSSMVERKLPKLKTRVRFPSPAPNQMPASFDGKLVVAISSRALFDLEESNRVFEEQGVAAYYRYQLAHESVFLEPGIAFSLVRKLIKL